ncbi:hypothetical protein NLI96_g9553 [Meripilus lineatus]|uniref:Uncharacterized protein n=1 Tax=Meripilus lineatus TaxID=2056292 RepID=A0AAD5UVD5_9APHY|nr:hypothetical protein NLI96_g9553 [Physisporinus lineatus]
MVSGAATRRIQKSHDIFLPSIGTAARTLQRGYYGHQVQRRFAILFRPIHSELLIPVLGFITVDEPRGFRSIIPRPIDLYSPQARAWVLPLDFVFSIAWSFELVTHLEELAFWLYLYTKTHKRKSGFPAGNIDFGTWYGGYHWNAPDGFDHKKRHRDSLIGRLIGLRRIQLFRVVFRFLFTLPLLILALDGIVEGSHPVNRSLFWTDFLVMIAGIGCFVSTTITLLIFFPRSIIKEAGYRPKAPTLPNSPKTPTSATPPSVALRFGHSHPQQSHFFPTPTVAINPMPPFIQTPPPISPPLTQEFSTEDDWETDDDCSSTGDHNMYRETDQVPPYPQSASSHTHSPPVPSQPPNPTSFPSSPVSSPPRSPPLHPSPPNEHVSIPMQFHHILPEQVPYQRHPFPYSLSSPQILSSAAPSSSTTLAPSPASPPQLRIPDGRVRHTRSHTHTKRPSHHRHHSRRVSASAAVGAERGEWSSAGG